MLIDVNVIKRKMKNSIDQPDMVSLTVVPVIHEAEVESGGSVFEAHPYKS